MGECGCRVPLAEVAATLGVSPEQAEAFAHQLGLDVGPDWAGRPALTPASAGRLVEAVSQRREELARLAEQQQDEAYRRAAAAREDWVRQQEAANAVGGPAQVVRRFDGHGNLVSES